MINILFIAPYPELREKVEYVFNNHPRKKDVDMEIRILTVDQVAPEDMKEYDVVIARGLSARRVQAMVPQMPFVDLTISGYDVIRTLAECRNEFGAKRIAICGFYGKMYETDSIGELLGCEVLLYPSESLDELKRSIDKAASAGCDALIGGFSAIKLAEERGFPSKLIHTGEDTILHAVNVAIKTAEQIKRERLIAEMYKTIIYTSKDGVLYVNAGGVIKVRNRVVKAMNRNMSLLDKPLDKTLPYLYKPFTEVLMCGQNIEGRVITIPASGVTVSASLSAVKVNGEISGVVITLTDITNIQSLESQIRRSLNEKGLIAKYTFKDIVHGSRKIEETIAAAVKYAASDSNIIIVGETGTGKELFAQSIHNASARKNGPFVAVNCAALPENLLESELFGYVEGAFTGTKKGGKMGLFEQAHEGTLFLDEISEISLQLQSKLLRVLQEREVRRIGDNKVISINVRIISATNRSISRLAREGAFRSDLMYRLDVLRIFLPPLRDRGKDAEALFMHLLAQLNGEHGVQAPPVEPDALSALSGYPFSGNVRELRNIVERTSALCPGETITKEDILNALYPEDIEDAPREAALTQVQPRREGEMDAILRVLEECGGNQSLAAKMLGINRSTLWRKLKKSAIAKS